MGPDWSRTRSGIGRSALSVALALLAGCVTAAICSCTVRERYAVLSFLFDGVPTPGSRPVEEPIDVSALTIDESRAAAMPRIFVHTPYRASECGRCHPTERILSTRRNRKRDFCFDCHEHETQKQEIDGQAYLHGPAAAGDCLVCHDPHRSRNRHLLTKPDPQLCYGCHERGVVLSRPPHDDLEREACVNCHNPHGANNRFLLWREASP